MSQFLATVSSTQSVTSESSLYSYFSCGTLARFESAASSSLNTISETFNPVLSDRSLNLALLYLYRKAADEVEKFNGKDFVQKIGIDKEGLLMSRSRIHEGQNFSETAELDFVKLGTLGINVSIPVIDRY